MPRADSSLHRCLWVPQVGLINLWHDGLARNNVKRTMEPGAIF